MAAINNKVEKCTLLKWIKEHTSEDDRKEVFLNMDIALKYIHDHNYSIGVFYPTRIEVLNDRVDFIQFDDLVELSSDPVIRSETIKKDIFNSTFIQIGLYMGMLEEDLCKLNPEFLKENFDRFSEHLPNDYVPYYRGVVQRGASVYLSDYTLEKTNRDLEQLDQQINESEGGIPLQKSNGYYVESKPLSNDRINDNIYSQINGLKDVAFINYLLIPTIALVSLMIIAFISWILSFL